MKVHGEICLGLLAPQTQKASIVKCVKNKCKQIKELSTLYM